MLSWAVLDENMPPAFYTLLWWPSGATFQCAWPDFFSSIQLTGFLCVGLIYLIFFLFFFRRSHGVSPPRGGVPPTSSTEEAGVLGDKRAERGGRGCAGRKHSSVGPGIFVRASCQLNHEQGSRCTQRRRLRCLPRAVIG